MEEEHGHDQRQHPLENPVVLDVIFGYLKDTDILVNAKQVCKAWYYQAGLSHWNPRRIYQNGGEGNGEEEEETPSLPFTTPSATLVQLKRMQDSCHGDENLLKAYRRFNYVIDGWTVGDNQFKKKGDKAQKCDTIGLERWFWRENGATIKIINVYRCNFPCDPTVFKIYFLEELPNLQSLKIKDCRFGKMACELIKAIAYDYRHGHYPLRESRPTYRTDKLKCLEVDGLHFDMDDDDEELDVWLPFLQMMNSLEQVVVRGMDQSSINDLVSHAVRGQRSKKLDIMKFHANRVADLMPRFPQIFSGSLEHLTLDIGFKTERQLVKNFIEIHGYTLKILHLYKAPLAPPYQDFALILDNLTELHLWGNVAKDLNFLKFLRNLQVLKWNTSCYGGNKLKGYLANGGEYEQIVTLFTDDLVEKTVQDLGGKISDKLHTLEIDWGDAMGVKSWRRLGSWMPNLKSLKAVVRGDKVLMEIGERWCKGLIRFEMGHGSWMESEMGVLGGFVGMEVLEQFIWRGCGCTRGKIEKELGEDARTTLENTLREVLRRGAGEGEGTKLVLPWMVVENGGNFEEICEEAQYRHALLSGGV